MENAKTLTPEQKEALKVLIEAGAKDNNITVLKQITYMQSIAARNKNEEQLNVLCQIKEDYLPQL